MYKILKNALFIFFILILVVACKSPIPIDVNVVNECSFTVKVEVGIDIQSITLNASESGVVDIADPGTYNWVAYDMDNGEQAFVTDNIEVIKGGENTITINSADCNYSLKK